MSEQDIKDSDMTSNIQIRFNEYPNAVQASRDFLKAKRIQVGDPNYSMTRAIARILEEVLPFETERLNSENQRKSDFQKRRQSQIS